MQNIKHADLASRNLTPTAQIAFWVLCHIIVHI